MAFIDRNSCDACGQTRQLTTLLSIPYSSPILLDTLSDRYKGKITKEDFGDLVYEIRRCHDCGLLFQRYVPDYEFSVRLYSYEESRIELSLSKKRDANVDYFTRYALLVEKGLILTGKRPHEARVLDFGSGWGYFLRMTKAHGAHAEGVEISSERAEYARDAGLTIYSSIEETGDLHDFIYTDQTFEHIPSPLIYLDKLSKRLSNNGIIYIAVPNCKNTEKALLTAHKEIVHDLYPLEHINGFRNKSLRALALRAGLEIIPAAEMFSTLIRKAHLTIDGQFAQEAIKAFYTQHYSTSLWLRRKTK